ncbi:MAG: type IX secretion system membrane protein PorP/SprF [Adhaeribacter sp.]
MQRSLSFFLKAALCCLLLSGAGGVQAQQMPQYSQYIFNGLILNPAYAGSKGFLSAHASYRSQWAGLEGAPKTATFSLDGVNVSDRIGWGVYAIRDQIGAQSQTDLSANAAVRLKTGEAAVFSFGLALGASFVSFDPDRVHTSTPNDPAFTRSKDQTLSPDLKTGLYFHTRKFYAGLSVANLVQFDVGHLMANRPHLFFTSGYVLTLSDFLKFKPSFLLKDDLKGPTNADFNAFLLLQDRLWLGASYRRSLDIWQRGIGEAQGLEPAAAMAYMVELYPSEKIRIGYAYDQSKSGFNKVGSHEISLGYYFIRQQGTPTLTPRYF